MSTDEFFYTYILKNIENMICGFIGDDTRTYFLEKENRSIKMECIKKIKDYLNCHFNVKIINENHINKYCIQTHLDEQYQSDIVFQNTCINTYNILKLKYSYFGP